MVGVSFTLDDKDALGTLQRLESVLENPRQAYDALGAHFVFSTQRNIETETAPDGTKWRPLSPRTAEKRIGKGRRGYAHMLRVSARLFQSISYQVLDRGVEWGSNLVYARIHQLGGDIDMPGREATISLKNIRKKGNRFVKLGTRKATERVVSIRAHQVHIPARPYLGISAYDRQATPQIVIDQIQAEANL
jgi:phage virion morphogenesis protein